MERKKTLHDYLYENLKEQIQTGYYKYGEALPSMNQLCETYHVGIRTVRDVLSDLREQGMIRTEERRPAVIVYRKNRGGGPCSGYTGSASEKGFDSGGI